MTKNAKIEDRKTHLVSQLLDGVLSENDTEELNELLHADHIGLELRPSAGKTYSFSDLSQSKSIVFAMNSTSCPISKSIYRR